MIMQLFPACVTIELEAGTMDFTIDQGWEPQPADLVRNDFYDFGPCLVLACHDDGDMAIQKLVDGEIIYRACTQMDDWSLICRPETGVDETLPGKTLAQS